MDKRRWCTMEDVQEDLVRATGQQLPFLDADYLVYGERPPPPRICADEDSEMELQLGGVPATAGGTGGPTPPPDLCGITKMLRMVQNYGNEDSAKGSDTPTSPNDVIVISKPISDSSKRKLTKWTVNDRDSILASDLNPDVEEFVPRIKAPNYNRTSEDSTAEAEIDSDDRSVPLGSLSLHQYQIERDELAAMLKSRIYSAPRRERAAPPAPLVLRTPAYYETSAPAPEQQATDSLEKRTEESAHRTETTSANRAREPEPAAADEREVRASIHKVNNWLDGEPCVPAPSRSPCLSPAPHLGPVDYKRKQRAGGAAPPRPQRDAEAGAARAYVPSAHAHALGRQYAARAAGAAPPPAARLWERVQAELRRRDAEIARAEPAS